MKIEDVIENSDNKIIVYDALLYESLFQKNVDFIFGDIRNKNLLKN